MLGQPGVGAGGQPPGEHHPAGDLDRRAEQGVPGTDLAQAGDVGGAAAVEPVPLALEGVGGQVDRHPTRVGPGDRNTVGEQEPGAGEEPVQPALTAPQRPDGHRLHRVLNGHGQHRVRTRLDEGTETLGSERPHTLLEPDRVAQVLVPVLGVHSRSADPLPRHRREERHLGDTRLDPGQRRNHLTPNRFHLRRVRGVIHRDHPRPNLPGLTRGNQRRQPLRVTGNHHGRRTVDRSHRHTRVVRQQFPHLIHGQRHRHHPATTSQTARDRPAAQHNNLRRILQRQRTRNSGSRDLTLRMTQHRTRLNPERTPQPRKSNHHGKKHRLDDIHPLQRGLVAQNTGDLPVHRALNRSRALTEQPGELRRLPDKVPGHPHPLRTLTGEHEHRPGSAGHAPTGHRQVGQPGQQGLPVATRDHGPVLEHRPPQQGRGHVGGRQVGVVTEESGQPPGLRPQRLRCLGRQHPRHHTAPGGRGDRLGFVLQHDVGVGAAHPERRHPRPARPVHLRPRPVLHQQLHRARRPVDLLGGPVHVQGPGQHPAAHRLDHLDHTGHPGGGLGVPDVRLDRPQVQRFRAVLPVGGQQGLGLDRVTQGGAGAVRLDGVHVGRGQAGVVQRGPDHPLLRRPVRRGQPVRRAVLVDRRPPHHRQHPVPVATSIRQPLHHQDTDTLTPPGAVSGIRERLAPTIGGQPALTAEIDEGVGRGHDRRPGGQGQVALPLPQRLHRQVQRHQRRRTRRVHGDRRALEPQGVGDPAGGDAAGRAGAQVALQPVRGAVEAREVVGAHHTREHTCGAAAQRTRVHTRVLQRLPGSLQQHPLLRVHRQRLTRRDAEEGRVELGGLVQEAALPGVGAPGGLGVGVVERVGVPAAIGGEPADRVHPARDQVPQLRG
ncbi:hypothetical protein UO65_0723 [Actinokineospora spheciospongiae]|uniref:Uncharacterized protein n=1 Tax=Actinokineospora spheciospongiae TaxID=909613 RepID=W7J4P6_9PSEU|nr:hypothetical protein UO65_0723 [Actinokineospora spheciospongiae]